MRSVALALLAVVLLNLAVPFGIVADFLIERDRIARELCVQRLTPETMRTCHGQCYVMKKLRSVEQQEQRLPEGLRVLKLDDAVAEHSVLSLLPLAAQRLRSPACDESALEGVRSALEHVPWG